MTSRQISNVAWRICVAVSVVFAIGKPPTQSLSAMGFGSQNESDANSASGTDIRTDKLSSIKLTRAVNALEKKEAGSILNWVHAKSEFAQIITLDYNSLL